MASPYSDCRQVIRGAFIRRKVPLESVNILMASPESLRQYGSGLKKWWAFCVKEEVYLFNGSMKNVLAFLTEEFERKATYSSLNGYKSAISLILGPEVGRDDRIQRFFRGVTRLRLLAPRYNLT